MRHVGRAENLAGALRRRRARNVHMPGAKEFRDPAQIFAKFD
jgi:hypothetical protein